MTTLEQLPRTSTTSGDGSVLRWPIGALFVMHGIAHFVGLTTAFAAIDTSDSLDYLGGALTVSSTPVLAVLGVTWSLIGTAFVFLGFAGWAGRGDWQRTASAVTVASMVMCIAGLWASIIGIAVNLTILTGLRVGRFAR